MTLRIVSMALAPITMVFLFFGPLSLRTPAMPKGLTWTKPVKGAASQVVAKLEQLELEDSIGGGVKVDVDADRARDQVRWTVSAGGRRAMTFTADLDEVNRRRTEIRALISRGDAPANALPEALRSDEGALALFTDAVTEHMRGFSPPKLSDDSDDSSPSSYPSSSGYAYAPKPGEPMLDPRPSRY